eukprot:COSAG06_NODE_63886_length_261_cov_0.629630_1_plen_59_part_10
MLLNGAENIETCVAARSVSVHELHGCCPSRCISKDDEVRVGKSCARAEFEAALQQAEKM